MKKIGILTFHYADNFGAILQSYALQHAIDSLNDCKGIIINYVPDGFTYENRWGDSIEKALFYKKRYLFDEFLKKNCTLSNRTTCIENNVYDIYCVGSDQVWNTTYPDGNYFLHSIPNEIKKVSYATSIALSNDSAYLDKDYFKKYLQGFKYISIRESENIPMLNEVLNKECERQCDPTVLLSTENYEDIEEKIDIKEKYILFFWLINDDQVYRGIEYVNRLSRQLGLPIIHSLYGEYNRYINNSLGTMFYCSPGCFLSYIKNAEYVVTNSYHATLFSMRYKKQFNIFIVESMRNRFDTLFEIYGIENCVAKNTASMVDLDNPNYEYIEKAMQKEKKRGFEYLKKIVEG